MALRWLVATTIMASAALRLWAKVTLTPKLLQEGFTRFFCGAMALRWLVAATNVASATFRLWTKVCSLRKRPLCSAEVGAGMRKGYQSGCRDLWYLCL